MRNEGGWKRAGQRRYSQHKTEPRGMQRRFARSNTRSGSTVGIMDFLNRFAGVSTATRPAAKLFDFSSLSPAVQQHLQQVRGGGAARERRESWLRAAGGGRKAPGRSLSSNCLFVEGLADGSAPEAYCTSLHPQLQGSLHAPRHACSRLPPSRLPQPTRTRPASLYRPPLLEQTRK